MNKLLKSELFDSFELREAVLHTSFKAVIDGVRNKDFFDSDEPLPHYLSWQEVRTYIYGLMTGAKSPSYFKIVLATTQQKAQAISPDVETCFINLIFKDNQMTCTTGVAYKTFSLDKSPDHIWDEKMKQFLFKYEFL